MLDILTNNRLERSLAVIIVSYGITNTKTELSGSSQTVSKVLSMPKWS